MGPFFLLQKAATNPWPLTSNHWQSIPSLYQDIKKRNVCFLLHKYNYTIEQLAKDGSCEGVFPWQATTPSFSCWKCLSRHTSHRSAHTIDTCPLIHTMTAQESSDLGFNSLSRLLHWQPWKTWMSVSTLQPLKRHKHLWFLLITNILKSKNVVLQHALTVVTPLKQPAWATAGAHTTAQVELLTRSLRHFHPRQKCVYGI